MLIRRDYKFGQNFKDSFDFALMCKNFKYIYYFFSKKQGLRRNWLEEKQVQEDLVKCLVNTESQNFEYQLVLMKNIRFW